MTERLLTLNETARRLSLAKQTFYDHLPKFQANGLQKVKVGRCIRFREASLDRLIKKAAEREI